MNVSGWPGGTSPNLRAALGVLLGAGVFAVGVYRLFLTPTSDPCLGPFFLLWGCLAVWFTVRRWWGTVAWFELSDDALRYRRVGRATVHAVQLADVLRIWPMTRRRGTAYGIHVALPDRVLRFEYDLTGNVVRLRDALANRLPVSARPPREGE